MAENNGHSNPTSPKRSIATSIELSIFLSIVATTITASVISNILLYRSCIFAFEYTVDECKLFLSPIKTNATSGLEVEVQKYSTYISTVKIVLENVCPAILSLFVGVWSDTYGRKPLLVWPLLGMTISGILLVIFESIDSLNPWWLLATSIPFSITGGYVILFTGSYCYINDTSSPNNITIRMLLFDATTALGSFIGSMFTSDLIVKMGYINVLIFTASINMLAYAFTNICIMESLKRAIQGGARNLFNISHLKEMFKECFKQRPNNGRNQIILLAITKLFLTILFLGCNNLEYLYTRNKLHWSLKDYTTYSAISTVVTFVGSFLGVLVFQRVLRIGELKFLITALLMAICDNVIKVFATFSWQMYLSTFASPFKGLPLPLINSYVTKFLPEEDIAKVFALLCSVESLAPIIGPIIFNSLYSSSLSVLPGAIYVLSAIFNGICLTMLLCCIIPGTEPPLTKAWEN